MAKACLKIQHPIKDDRHSFAHIGGNGFSRIMSPHKHQFPLDTYWGMNAKKVPHLILNGRGAEGKSS